MIKTVVLLFALLLAAASAFAPQPFGVQQRTSTVCFAKHVKDKAAKWAKAKRPKKHRLSDINRTPIIYELHSLTKPSEYNISEAPAAPVAKPAQTE